MNTFTEFFIVVSLATLAKTTPYTIDEFEDHLPGLYLEYIAQVHTNVDHWSLMIAIDLDRIRLDYTQDEQIADMFKECPDMPITCETLLGQAKCLKRKGEQINRLFENINQLLLDPRHINPKGLPGIPLPALDSSLVIHREKQVKDLKEEVTNNYNIAIQEARIPGTSILEYNKAIKSWL